MFAPTSRCFPENQASIVFSLDRQGGLGQPVAVEQFAVEDDVRPAVGGGALERGVQILCLGGEYRHAFVAVAVRGRPRDPETGAQQRQILVLTKPDEYEQCLVEAGQGACLAPGAAGAALGLQQPRYVLHQFPRDVDHGTISQHVEPSRRRGSVARPVYRWLHVCFEDRPELPIHPCRPGTAVIPC